MKIVRVRHGRSAHVQTGWLDLDGLHRWRAAYDEAGIMADETPPAARVELARGAGVLAASDLPRAGVGRAARGGAGGGDVAAAARGGARAPHADQGPAGGRW